MCYERHMRLRIAAALSLVAWACGSTTTANPCVPTQGFTGGGNVSVQGHPDYAVTTGQAEDFLNGGTLTITAGEADAGAGSLGANDPVIFIQMRPSPDDPGTYQLSDLKAKLGSCPADAKLVAQNGTVSGCSKGALTTVDLQGTVTVKSGQEKKLDVTTNAIDIHIGFGQSAQTCQ